MTKEEARNVFGGSIVNNLLSLGAEPTNVVRQDGLIEWKSDGYIEVGGVQVWAYYYFEDGEDVDRCDWEDHMEIEVGMLDLKSVDKRFMYLTELREKDIYVGDKKCKRVKIYVGRPLRDTPKTYKRIGGFVAKELSNAYNSGCVSIYEAKDKTLRYSVYRDGCFYPYYGKLEVVE